MAVNCPYCDDSIYTCFAIDGERHVVCPQHSIATQLGNFYCLPCWNQLIYPTLTPFEIHLFMKYDKFRRGMAQSPWHW